MHPLSFVTMLTHFLLLLLLYHICYSSFCRFETYETNLHPPSRVGTRVRVAATSILNINLSAANIDVLGQAVESWRKQRELEKKAIKIKVIV